MYARALHRYVKFLEQIIFWQKKLKRKTWFEWPWFFFHFKGIYGPWFMPTLVNMTWSQAQSNFSKHVLDLSDLILISETEQRDISIWFWWVWSACTLKEQHSGKDWKFLLRKSKVQRCFLIPDTYMLQMTLETLFHQFHIYFIL